MEHLKLESITDSPDFWNDPYLISSYCNSILQATKKEEDEVSILICDYNAVPKVSYDKRNSKNKYSIYLPKLKDFYMDLKIQKDDIKLRKAFLKHELAHIVFSEMETYVDHHKDSDVEIRMLANAIEDVRIEWAFGKRFPGSNDTFFEVQNSFYLKGKSQIENDAPSILNLSLYFLYRSKKFEFENTLPVQIYDRIFEKYSDFLSLSKPEILTLLKQIQGEFNSEQEALKEEIEEFKENIPEKETIQMTQKEYDDYTSDRDIEENSDGNGPEIEITDDKKKNQSSQPASNPQESQEKTESEPREESKKDDSKEENSNILDKESYDSNDSNKLDSDSEDDSKEENSENDSRDRDSNDSEENSEEEEDYSDSENDSEDSSQDSSGDSSENQKQNNSQGSSLNNKLDFSDMIKDQMKNNLEKEQKNINDFNSEEVEDIDEDISSLEEKITDPDDSESEKRVLNILKIINPISDDYISQLVNSHDIFEDFLKYSNSKSKSRGSRIVDISRFLAVSSKRKKPTKKTFKNNSNFRSDRKRTIYSQLASKNSKNIIGLINFFKLKFQNKEKSKRFFNKEEGDLHNESLYKIFSHEQDKRIFSNIQKSLVIKEDVSFLLDFSGSMTGSKLKYLLESLVILNEVFSKIEIPYNVFSFSGREPRYYFKYSSFSEKTILTNAFNSRDWEQGKGSEDQISFFPRENKFYNVIFGLINRNSKSEERKKIIELLLEIVFGAKNYNQISSILIGGSTPEVPAVISLYNNLPKQKLFIINDGEYDSFDFFGKEIKEIKNIDRQNIRNIDYYKIGYTLLSGKKIKINNLQEKNVFTQSLRSIINVFPYNFKSNFIYKFFSDINGFNSQQDLDINTVQNIYLELKRFIEDIYYDNKLFSENNSSYSSKNKYFTIEKKYFQGKDSTDITFTINESLIPKFSLKVHNKIITENYKEWSQDPTSCNLFLDSDYITDIKDVYKILCFHRASSLMSITDRVDLSRYTYRDLIAKMRNSGWSIFGLGIESDSGRHYIGDKNFTFIKNHNDIRANLEKKVKKIVI